MIYKNFNSYSMSMITTLFWDVFYDRQSICANTASKEVLAYLVTIIDIACGNETPISFGRIRKQAFRDEVNLLIEYMETAPNARHACECLVSALLSVEQQLKGTHRNKLNTAARSSILRMYIQTLARLDYEQHFDLLDTCRLSDSYKCLPKRPIE